ncbi:carbohydrate ABC transporter permease [Streptomyces sp. NPDC051664]|uniref:carbohydrate ABC transporter permease n=1 Tax=Streptomyces sp. NPDC051664 TaxID=3365668 RepID=UPI0037BE1936
MKHRRRLVAAGFILPCLLLLGALVGYPIVFTVVRSLFDSSGDQFVGVGNYREMFTDPATLRAIRNTALWVAVAPALLTGLGLIFAVLTEKIRWATAFKVIIFMPMAISFLAAGITFRLVYEQDPERGVLNAMTVGVHDAFDPATSYPNARVRPTSPLKALTGGGFTTKGQVSPGGTLAFGLVGIREPTGKPATPPAPASRDTITGTVYVDYVKGGGGRPGLIDRGERGLAGIKVELVREGRTVVSTATTHPNGSFQLSGANGAGTLTVRLAAQSFAAPYEGVSWLSPALITPAVIGAYLWIWTGFSMVLIGAGLAALPRETLEAARVDGAGEWQIFRRVTVPLLAPVLTVVFVTLLINVMKVFDLVYIIAPGPVQQDASVLALQLWLVSFGGGNDQGVGSAIGVVLLLLVVPAMIFNIRRFRGSRA